MREEIDKHEEENESPDDVSSRICMAKGKLLWEQMAAALQEQFNVHFEPDSVRKKWVTLMEGYKKAVANNKTTGSAPSKFKFINEMAITIGDRNDIKMPVLLTQNSLRDEREVLGRRTRKRRHRTDGLVEPETPTRVRRRCLDADDIFVNQLEQISKNMIRSIEQNTAAMLQLMAEQTRSFEQMFMALLHSGRNANNADNLNS